MRHTLGHRPARRVGPPSPALLRNRAHQLVEPRLRAAIFIGDQFELRMHVSSETAPWVSTRCSPLEGIPSTRPTAAPFPPSDLTDQSPPGACSARKTIGSHS